jgi:hypothetical protein
MHHHAKIFFYTEIPIESQGIDDAKNYYELFTYFSLNSHILHNYTDTINGILMSVQCMSSSV